MKLQFTETWEQALLTEIACIAADEIQESKVYLGRTAIQKILYFLQVGGVPMRYRFDIYHYGPYCDRITRDVDLLIADDVLKDASANSTRYSNYQASTSAGELLDRFAEDILEYKSEIEKIVKSLLPLEPTHLELLATLDYLYRQENAAGGSESLKAKVIERFIKVKKDKFPHEKISQTYDSMVKANIFES